jgi:glycine/D-amino acid oxidase-like deaminating enzyme
MRLSRPSPDTRIAVLGAGAAGLTAAWRLRRLGYRNVVVFEADSRAGGKVSTFRADGHPVELGAIWYMNGYRTVFGLAGEVGVPLAPDRREIVFIDPQLRLSSPRWYTIKKHGPAAYFAAQARYALSFRRAHPQIHTHGLDATAAALGRPFLDVLGDHGLSPLATLLHPLIAGCGYGFGEEIPAIYHLKLADFILLGTMRSHLRLGPLMRVIPGGMESLWTELARRLDVRLSTPVEGVTRAEGPSGPRITLRAGGATVDVDRLVVAAPAPALTGVLDLRPAERALFDKLRTCRYLVTLFREGRLPRGKTIFLPEHAALAARGHVLTVDNQWPGSNLWIGYQQLAPATTREEARATLERDVAAIGGRVEDVVLQREWDYFPHVPREDFSAALFRGVEAMQGTLGTHYVGSMLNFETVEHAAGHAARAVANGFGGPAPAAG